MSTARDSFPSALPDLLQYVPHKSISGCTTTSAVEATDGKTTWNDLTRPCYEKVRGLISTTLLHWAPSVLALQGGTNVYLHTAEVHLWEHPKCSSSHTFQIRFKFAKGFLSRFQMFKSFPRKHKVFPPPLRRAFKIFHHHYNMII